MVFNPLLGTPMGISRAPYATIFQHFIITIVS